MVYISWMSVRYTVRTTVRYNSDGSEGASLESSTFACRWFSPLSIILVNLCGADGIWTHIFRCVTAMFYPTKLRPHREERDLNPRGGQPNRSKVGRIRPSSAIFPYLFLHTIFHISYVCIYSHRKNGFLNLTLHPIVRYRWMIYCKYQYLLNVSNIVRYVLYCFLCMQG